MLRRVIYDPNRHSAVKGKHITPYTLYVLAMFSAIGVIWGLSVYNDWPNTVRVPMVICMVVVAYLVGYLRE